MHNENEKKYYTDEIIDLIDSLDSIKRKIGKKGVTEDVVVELSTIERKIIKLKIMSKNKFS